MNRVLMISRERIAVPSADRELLDRFLAARDEAAFAELVRRYGPVVWGACRRRLTDPQDAEDAFQATFLVLVRRAARLGADVPLGPWLYKVAVMTAGNVIRSNRRRGAVTGPMEHDVPAPAVAPVDDRLDIDAALLALPERDRAPVVLCHLQGLTRREAAERLGCPEGTLSARLSRALRRLRTRLGDRVSVVLGAGAVAVPAGLASATARAAGVYSTSVLTAAGVSPVVAGLTDGVLRMFWMKKATTAAVLSALVLGAGVFALGTLTRSENVARADEPAGKSAPPAKVEAPDPLKRLEKRLADLEKQKELLDATLEDLKAEKQKLEDAKREKAAATAAAELGKDVAVTIAAPGHAPAYTVREVVNGHVAEVTCSNLDALTTYLTRARNDPKGPQGLRLSVAPDHPADDFRIVVGACVSAGYRKAVVGYIERTTVTYRTRLVTYYEPSVKVTKAEMLPSAGEIDLTKYVGPKKP
ncbi:MAG: sigma-70 family RNA polymerase sigma factor [Planctomycetes bacterium]|nr:sigma-70 family RNA polymerase sigma factor [Planctomycetota bacterium]